ncbi:hypothetical protein [Litchfieldia salsa]|uniref:Uncharacterized protein n=1 Tax=Litchfieldia salsa TaxID=930152 RepID=A0A1H0VSM0_9BACI|nr:hypothetical protein [Litchfieldia salsa]SDP81589.1 hypothetical protein SAMN05216565_107211 [Litchfieldia salsa]
MKKVLIFIFLIFCFLFVGCSSQEIGVTNLTKSAISDTITKMEDFEKVEKAEVIVNALGIQLLIEVPPDFEIRQAQMVGEQMARILSNQATNENKKEGLGEIYDDYNLSISVTRPNDTMVTYGTKSTTNDSINWD